jgi:hypothetical protein
MWLTVLAVLGTLGVIVGLTQASAQHRRHHGIAFATHASA